MSTNILMPEMGEGVIEGTVVSWLKTEGDTVKADEALLEIETDKVTVEVNSEVDGVLLKACIPQGETVEVGTVLAIVGEPDEDVSDAGESRGAVPVHAPEHKPTNGHTEKQSHSGISRDFGDVRVSPVVARMVEEHDIDLTRVEGTGRNGRITKNDVLAYMETVEVQTEDTVELTPSVASPVPMQTPQRTETAPAKTLPMDDGELMPLTGMRRAIAEHMVLSKRVSPHVTTVFEFDFSAITTHRSANKDEFERGGIKLTYMPYIILATVEALKKHPLVNASWTEEGVLLKRDINIGMATAVAQGLLVPVIRHADEMNLRGLARQINDLAERARINKLQPAEVQGGTFTITNHGSGGSLIGTPIINQPQVGILGIGVIEKRVKVIDDMIAIRPCAYVSFSFDHRILDGATADAFVTDIKQFIENFQ